MTDKKRQKAVVDINEINALFDIYKPDLLGEIKKYNLCIDDYDGYIEKFKSQFFENKAEKSKSMINDFSNFIMTDRLVHSCEKLFKDFFDDLVPDFKAEIKKFKLNSDDYTDKYIKKLREIILAGDAKILKNFIQKYIAKNKEAFLCYDGSCDDIEVFRTFVSENEGLKFYSKLKEWMIKTFSDLVTFEQLIEHNEYVTYKFFFCELREKLNSILRKIYAGSLYEDNMEPITALYLNLMENDAKKLRNFKFEGSLISYMTKTAKNYFIDQKRKSGFVPDTKKDEYSVIENTSEDCLNDKMEEGMEGLSDLTKIGFTKEQWDAMLHEMCPRYREVIFELYVNFVNHDPKEEPFEPRKITRNIDNELAQRFNVNKDAYYNIKKRAHDKFNIIAIKYIDEHPEEFDNEINNN